jgi:hypothetical protein
VEDVKEFVLELLLDGIEGIGIVGRVDGEVEEFGDLVEGDLIEGEIGDAFVDCRDE